MRESRNREQRLHLKHCLCQTWPLENIWRSQCKDSVSEDVSHLISVIHIAVAGRTSLALRSLQTLPSHLSATVTVGPRESS